MADLLIVKNDQDQRTLLEEGLQEEGHFTRSAARAANALEQVRSNMPDLVVLDLAMPGMDGIELLWKLLAINSRLPVVIHTAYPSYKDNFMTWGADVYVVKQSDIGELKTSIRQILADPERRWAHGV
jgi:DNA-binding response OmpR family regulator